MTVTFDRPQLQCKASAQSVVGGDHLGSGQMRGFDQGIQVQAHQIGDKQEETATAGGKGAWSQRQLADVGNRFDGGAEALVALLV
jgi:hypothetical protein